MKKPITAKTRCSWWPVAVIIGAACAFCWPVFIGRIMSPADMCLLMLPWRELQAQFPDWHRPDNPILDPIQQYLPWRIYAVESLRNGVIPLWNPYAFCGTPFLANLQSTVLYLPNVLFLITGARHGFGISTILHLILGGLCMYGFLRTLALGQAAALLGALVLMFNGWVVTWLEYPTMSLWVFMWLPALLLCYERALRQPRSLYPTLCPAIIGALLLGGHFQIASYVLLAFALYAITRLLRPNEAHMTKLWSVALAAVILLVGIALAAAQILPTLELAQATGRTAHSTTEALRTAFPITHFLLYLIPNFFGNSVDYNYWGDITNTSLNFFETACYVGILPLFLATLAFTGKRRWRHWYFGGLVVFAVLAAIGSPIYLALYYLAPGFKELAGLGRVLCLASFGIAGLAGLGLDELLTNPKGRRTRLVIFTVAGMVLVVLVGYFGVAGSLPAVMRDLQFGPYLMRQLIAAALLLAAAVVLVLFRSKVNARTAAWLAILLVGVDLGWYGLRFNPFVEARMAYPETDSIRWLQDHAGHERVTSLATTGMDWMPHNSPMIFGLRDIHGSDSLRPRRAFELVSGPTLAQSEYPTPDAPLFDTLGVKYLMTRARVGEGWTLILRGQAPIYENMQAQPRARLVATSDASREPAGTTVTWQRDDPQRLTLETRSTVFSDLLLTDTNYPGWRVEVDGKPADIALAEEAFRAVAVPAGQHRVEFRYDPASFRVGLFVSLLACALLVGWITSVLRSNAASAARTAGRS